MRKLIEGLYRDPALYDSHSLADDEFIKALLADVRMPLPVLSVEGGSGVALFRTLGVLVLDGLDIELSQREGDAGECDEELVIGLVLTWFKYIRPGLYQDKIPFRPPATNRVVGVCSAKETVLELLDNIPSAADRSHTDFDWIPKRFAELRSVNEKSRGEGKKPAGERTADNYRDKALLFVLRRIERTAARLNRRIADLLPELASPRPQVLKTESVAEAEIQPIPGLDWHARLSRCLADYRAYELREIERLLGEAGLPTSFEWFLDRQVSYPAAPLADEGNPRSVSLADICKPGLRIALSDHRGSGTTTALAWLSNRYCRDAMAVEPVVLRIDARDYADSAANDISVYTYLAEKMYGRERSAEESRKRFEETLSKAQVVCLVDNLARSPPEDQARIGRRLRRFAGIVYTANPWASDEEIATVGGQGTTHAVLEPLGEVQVRQFVIEFGSRAAPGFDELFAQRLACDMPDIAALPLGLTALCEEVRLYRGDFVSVAQRFVRELFLRSGKPAPDWQ
jgi:hypothetical protein